VNIKAWLNDTGTKTNNDIEFNNELMRFFYYASLELKKLNDQGTMAIINHNAIDVTFQGPIKFNNVTVATSDYRLTSIQALAGLMIGINLGQVDYAFSNEWIKDNYAFYKDFLPIADERYYNAVINENKPVYYCDFKSNPEIIPHKQEDTGLGIADQTTKVKSTPSGRAWAEGIESPELERKAAFANIIFIPLIAVLISIVVLFVYFYFFY
jgi:hypothetical protein